MNSIISKIICLFIKDKEKKKAVYKLLVNDVNRDTAKRIYKIINSGQLVKSFDEPIEEIKKKISNLDRLVRASITVSELPAATGNLRLQQIASLSLLKKLTNFFNEKGIKYWLDYGTLLGAVRHKGFIPWDDDIDISMIRSDYEKFKQCIHEFCVNGFSYSEGDIIRVFYKDTSAQVDVFAYDSGTSVKLPDSDEYKKIIGRIKEQYRKIPFNNPKNYRKGIIPDDYKKRMQEILMTEILQNKPVPEKAYMFSAYHTIIPNRELFSYDDIFPLVKLPYEDAEFPCPHKYINHLVKLYGDYMALPNNLASHGMINRLNVARIEKMHELIEMVD